MIAFPGRLGFFDHARLVEDLRSFGGPIAAAAARGQTLHPPLAMLERCGADILFASPADLGARALQADDGFLAWLEAQDFGRAAEGDVPLTWLAAAAALGRRDLRPRFRGPEGLDLDAMLRWLVLYGIAEHGLFGLARTRFQRALLRPGRRNPMAPLARLLLQERPDLKPLAMTGEPGVSAGLRRWLAHGGAGEYRLHWCLPADWLGPGHPVPRDWAPPAPPPVTPRATGGAFADRLLSLSFPAGAPLPEGISDRAMSRAVDGGALVHAKDFMIALPRPGTRAAVLLIRAAPLAEAPEEAVLVVLHGSRPLGAAVMTPRAGGTAAFVLRDLPPGATLPLWLCRVAPARMMGDDPWALWQGLWLMAA